MLRVRGRPSQERIFFGRCRESYDDVEFNTSASHWSLVRKFFWILILFGAYLWAASSGYDALLWERGKELYQKILHWLEDADIDYHLQKSKSHFFKRWD